MFAGFVLELGHAAKFTELGTAAHEPAHFGMAADMALDENQALLRVNAAGQQQGKGFEGLLFALGRVNVNRQGVQVGDKVVAVVVLLHFLPVLHRAQIVAQGKGACGLNARENDFFVFHMRLLLLACQEPKSPRQKIVSVRDEILAVPPCFMAVPCP